MAKFLVTGGCGFIGSHLCERLLAAGHEVRVLDDLSTGKTENLPAGVGLTVGDIADRQVVDRAVAGVQGVFHLAAVASVVRSMEDWLGTHRTNLTGTITVFEAARRHGKIPVVYASSAAVYGDNPHVPLREAESPRPLSAYGADKLGCEHHAQVATLVHGVPTTGFRFFNVFGPRQDPKSPYSGVISIFVERLLTGQPLNVFGDGLQSRDFVYVGDVVDHLMAAMERPSPEARVFNVCTGHETRLVDLIETLNHLTRRKAEVVFLAPRAGEIRQSLGSPALCRKQLGVSAATSLADGLEATLKSLALAD